MSNPNRITQPAASRSRRGHKIVGAIVGSVALMGMLVGCADLDTTDAAAGPASSAPAKTGQVDKTKATQKAAPKVSVAKRQAVAAAENYLDTAPFSKKGLIAQLKFDKHSAADAKYAVNHIDVDWNEQAEKAAANYLDTMPMSQGDLVEQLKFDGFTSAQAEHGASAAFEE